MLIERLHLSLAGSDTYSAMTKYLMDGRDPTIAAAKFIRPLLVASNFSRRPRPTFVVVSGEEAAERFWRQTAAYLGQERVLRFPDSPEHPWSEDKPEPSIIGARARALYSLDKGRDVVVVASARSLLRHVPPQGSSVFTPLVLESGMTLDLEESMAALARMGYERLEVAEEVGTFAVRGGTLDVYPAGSHAPLRAEFFGDEIDSLRHFVPGTGQSIGDAGRTEVYPCRALQFSKRGADAVERAVGLRVHKDEQLAHHVELIKEGIYFNGAERYLPLLNKHDGLATDYLSTRTLIVVTEPRSLFDDTVRHYEALEAAVAAAKYHSVKPGVAALEGLYASPAKLDFGDHQRLTFLSVLRAGGIVDGELTSRRPDVGGGEEKFVGGVRSLASSGYSVLVAVPDRRARGRIRDTIAESGVSVAELREHGAGADDARVDLPLEAGSIVMTDLDVPAGYVVPEAKLAVVSVDDIYPRSLKRARRRDIDPTRVTFGFAPGDYVVHSTHGIALFREMVRQTVLGSERDYLLLEYAKGDRLFVPVDQIDRVTKFVGPDQATPRVTRLNTADWSKATGKARLAAKKLAFDLVDLYARRSTVLGRAYGADTVWQEEMEAMFPFVETPDQLAAIADVKSDMESEKPMDRLICGDVGYGKTEVAIRAAFKAAQDGAQVMVLCPTTILAQQHYTNFSERFAPFDVRVEVLSRFRTPVQQKLALEGFASGEVRILIGTHRLLSRDVAPKDLGLVIIDEEQRFGVEHKEYLKNLREQVDILTLSATPIPRTLQMSLTGVRDMSVIDTPPPNRFPVQVHVGEWDEDVVSGAIRRELERGGQVYYVSNRVRTIDDAVERVRISAPEARIGVAHGQMSEKELEAVMEAFAANEYDVLVATTIIESGIDNPHSNTLIIEDSQRLGLAQLYQLKGRVGRSHVKAFAYFLFPRDASLTEQAIDRLTAIKDNEELGSGIRVAMRDLEIRGAGSLLGAEQSGQLSAVGFDLFATMLMEAVSEARGEPLSAHPDIRVDLPVPAYFPEEYIDAVDQRVRYYRRLAGAPTVESVGAVAAELAEAHGAPPEVARNLIDVARIKALAADAGITTVTVVRNRLTVSPVSLEGSALGKLQADGAVYTERKKELARPIGYGESVTAAALGMLTAIYSAQSDHGPREE